MLSTRQKIDLGIHVQTFSHKARNSVSNDKNIANFYHRPMPTFFLSFSKARKNLFKSTTFVVVHPVVQDFGTFSEKNHYL